MELSSIWSVILSLVSESGVWAMLFLALLIMLIKSNNSREEKYQNVIEKLGNSLKKVEEIKEDVEDLKYVAGIGGKQKKLEQKIEIKNDKNQQKENQNDTQRKS